MDVTETLVVPKKAHRKRNQFQRGVLRARRAVKAVVYGTYSVFVWDLLVLCSCGFLLYQASCGPVIAAAVLGRPL